ncbi:MAG: efflux RND transporter permease subunit [Verrucomicrobia bacterium]|nr:efflux RND transporter permease subunit [Verrucomicrobiota bacterium]
MSLPSETGSGGPIRWMAGNSVAANLLMLLLLVGGLIMALRIQQEVFPEFELDVVNVSVSYPGASPEEVERSILLAIEEVARGVNNVDEVQSVASEGSGLVTVEVIEGADVQRVAQDLKNEIDRITSLPEDAEEPTVTIADRRRAVMTLILYGNQSEAVLREAAEIVRDNLQQDDGITLVELAGIRNHEISIEVTPEKLRDLGMTIDELAQKIASASVEIPGGGIKTSSGEILLRMNERRDFGPEFETIPVLTTALGTPLLLRDVATIRDDFEDVDQAMTYDGVPALQIIVYRVGDETPIEISERTREHLEELNRVLPEGLSLAVWQDRSEIFKQRAELLLKNAFFGLVVVFLLLSLFLEARLAFWVMMGIPISFLGCFLVLPMLGASINMVSMFAFIIALGIVVDDAIVVGENIYENHQNGMPFIQAAGKGAIEMAQPVVFSILTNCVAFLPLLFIPGTTGKIFAVIPVVVISVFLISLIEALFILPAHLGHHTDPQLRGVRGFLHHRQQAFSHWFSRMVQEVHGPLLTTTLHHRYIACAIGILMLVTTVGYVKSGRIGMTLFPRIEADYAFASVTLPYGSPVERTIALKNRLVEAAREVADLHGGAALVKGILAEVGIDNGSNVAEISVLLTDPEVRPISTSEFSRQWRSKVGQVAGVENLQFQADRGGPGSGSALTVELSHRNLDKLRAAGEDLALALADYPIVTDINDGFQPGKPQFDFSLTPEGHSLGLTAREIARQIRNAYYGTEVTRQQRGRFEMKVMVRFPESERRQAFSLEQFVVRSPSGTEVPLAEVVERTEGRAYTSINRRNGRRVINVTADVTPPDQAGRIIEAVKQEVLPGLIDRYPGLSYSFEGRQQEQRESMSSLVVGFLLAMLAIYALLAIPFRSYSQPLIIMVSIPFGIVGAVLGHILMGYSLSVLSMFGIVALSGVVVNDSLILIDYANGQRRLGLSAFDAIRNAGIRRFRPIMLTTLSTFGGLAPMIFETSRQARFLIPMAISLGFGILFSTLIVLGLVPSLYLIVEDLRAAVKRGWRWIWQDTPTT